MKMNDNERNELDRKIVIHSKDLMQVFKEFKRIIVNGMSITLENENGKKIKITILAYALKMASICVAN